MQKGFTLLEILIAGGLLAVIAFGVVLLPLNFKKGVDLDGQSAAIVEALNLSQSNAKSRLAQSSWGVHLQSDRYVLFRGSPYNPSGPQNQTYWLAGGFQLSQINLNGSSTDVLFDEFSGETSNFGSFRVSLASSPDQYREIHVDYSGRAAVFGGALPPLNTRVFDSRHVHYQLGWSIKNSTKLVFNFPRVAQIQEVATAEYFNPDKSDFDWSDSFTVGGSSQEFRVHTHSLADLDTLLSVTRDRSGTVNNEEVWIYIDRDGVNRPIAHYLADGSVEIGDYGGVMTIQ